ncbi:hypothetical protein BpHYR1_040399 [Brachionus plicatilis]|uniref:Uncharacterized protein n=1 Tax=Brachionus plicatilis TaxID=10195 RepID=A0A3M7P4N4_BRAPC|nr:hypothetical protein BpHYR1_040399 [Brachionus plicatilis]
MSQVRDLTQFKVKSKTIRLSRIECLAMVETKLCENKIMECDDSCLTKNNSIYKNCQSIGVDCQHYWLTFEIN